MRHCSSLRRQRSMSDLLTQQIVRLLETKREAVARTIVDWRDGAKLIEVPIPLAAARLPGSSGDAVDSLSQTALDWDHWRKSSLAVADRLLLPVGGRSCPPRQLRLTLVYEGPLRFSRSLTIDVPGDGDKTLVVAAAFYTPLERFRGIAVPADRISCIADVSKILDHETLPSIFTAVLAPDWKNGPLFQRPGGF